MHQSWVPSKVNNVAFSSQEYAKQIKKDIQTRYVSAKGNKIIKGASKAEQPWNGANLATVQKPNKNGREPKNRCACGCTF